MVGLAKFDGKDRRRQRRTYKRNHIAQDLHTPKYRQRIKEDRKSYDDFDDDYDYEDEE